MTDLLFSFFFACFARLPLKTAQRIGAITGTGIYSLSGSYRQKFDAQWSAAGYSPNDVQKKIAIAQTGAMMGEIPFVWSRNNQDLMRWVHYTPQALHVLQHCRGKPTIFVTPHLGAFEVAGRAVSVDSPMTALFKPAKNAALSALMLRARTNGLMKTTPATIGGVRALLKALKNNENIAILPDQVPSDGDGVWVSFLGKPAYTITLPQKLARNAQCVVLMLATRLEFGAGWQVDLTFLDRDPSPQYLNDIIEKSIRQHPTQYLWGYNRFKGESKSDDSKTI